MNEDMNVHERVLEKLRIWSAYNSAGEPVVITGSDDNGGISLNLFLGDDNVIVGAEVWTWDEDGDDLTLTHVAGNIPGERIDELVAEGDWDQFQPQCSDGCAGQTSDRQVEIWSRTETGMITENGKSFEYESTFTAVD